MIATEILELNERAMVLATGSNIDRRDALRQIIMQVESTIAGMDDAVGDDPFPLEHTFTDGAYARRIVIPAGVLLVGKIHRHAHFNCLLRGDVSLLTEEGATRIQGPLFMESKAGTKRVVYTHTETEWVTMHVSEETDLHKLEIDIIAPSYAALGELR